MKYDVIVTASGKALRSGLGYNKVLFKMKNNKTVLEESCHLFIEDKDCEKVIVVIDEDIDLNNSKIIYVKGGTLRKDSVKNGLDKVDAPYVLVHDGARPFLLVEDLNKIKNTLEKEDAAILAKKCVETVKYVEDGYIKETIDRNNIYLAQTPQGAKTELLKKAYLNEFDATDEASLLEHIGVKVKIVEGNPTNIKLTNKEDFIGL